MEIPDTITGALGLIIGILYAVESIPLVIFIIVKYNAIVTGDINIIPALLIMYAVPGVLWFIAAILEAIVGAVSGKGQ